MKYKAVISIMPHHELLDPQGKTVEKNLPQVGVDGISEVRIGKRIECEIEAEDKAAAREKVEIACKKLLANLIIEKYSYDLTESE